MLITYIEYFLWLFYLTTVQITLKNLISNDTPIRRTLWNFSVLIMFIRLFDLVCDLNINYRNNYVIFYFNFFIMVVHHFLQGMILAKVLVVVCSKKSKFKESDKFVYSFTIFLVLAVLFTVFSNTLKIPKI